MMNFILNHLQVLSLRQKFLTHKSLYNRTVLQLTLPLANLGSQFCNKISVVNEKFTVKKCLTFELFTWKKVYAAFVLRKICHIKSGHVITCCHPKQVTLSLQQCTAAVHSKETLGHWHWCWLNIRLLLWDPVFWPNVHGAAWSGLWKKDHCLNTSVWVRSLTSHSPFSWEQTCMIIN